MKEVLEVKDYTAQSFYLSNQESLSKCLEKNVNNRLYGCVDLSKTLPVKQLFDKIFAEYDEREHRIFPPLANPDAAGLKIFINSVNGFTCWSSKGTSTEYAFCRGFAGNSNYFYDYVLDQGADSVWHERLMERHHTFLANVTSPKLGEEFVEGMMHGVKPQNNNIAVIAITGLAALTLFAGLYKWGSYCFQHRESTKVSFD
jgi:hypothetical protein